MDFTRLRHNDLKDPMLITPDETIELAKNVLGGGRICSAFVTDKDK